jgi:NADH-quinone oxidoreductase subunit N
MIDFNYYLLLPVITLAAYALLMLLLSPWVPGRHLGAIVAPLGLVMTGAMTWSLWRDWKALGPMTTAHGLYRVDGLGLFLSAILLVIGILTVFASLKFLEREADHGEFYALLLLCLAGMFVMVHTTHLMVVLIGLEVFSLALYVMTGLTRGRVRSIEAALKYFLLGAFSSGFMVYGMALLYGATGSLDLGRIGQVVVAGPTPMLWIGMGLVLVGLSFKIAVVPFHHWVPDVYTGAPTNVAAFMATATKAAAFVVLLRLLMGSFGSAPEAWVPVITVLAILTMTVANLVALAQTNIKRLLAFSSISHAGYLLIAVVCRPDKGVGAILFYLATYAFMTLGAFFVAASLGRGDAKGEQGYDLWSWSGIGWRQPALATAMTVFMFSLAGIPPTGGFIGKYVIFQAAVDAKAWLLAVVGVLNAVVGAYYYLRVVVTLWMKEPEEELELTPVSPSMATVLVVAVVGVFYLGLAPQRVLELVRGLAATLI